MKMGAYLSGSSIIRCTSNVRRVTLRMEATTGGPIVRFGTKWPSITSRCSMVAPPRSTCAICSPKRAKSAARMEGNISGICRKSPILACPSATRLASAIARGAQPQKQDKSRAKKQGEQPERYADARTTAGLQVVQLIKRLVLASNLRGDLNRLIAGDKTIHQICGDPPLVAVFEDESAVGGGAARQIRAELDPYFTEPFSHGADSRAVHRNQPGLQ